MRVCVSIGEVVAEIEYDDSYTPEVAADLLQRASSSVLTMFLALPDAATPATGDE